MNVYIKAVHKSICVSSLKKKSICVQLISNQTQFLENNTSNSITCHFGK